MPTMGLTVGLACGSFHGTDVPEPDAAPQADGATTIVDAGPCRKDNPFGDVFPLFADESALPYSPTVPRATTDELTLYFQGYMDDASADLNLYAASRTTTKEPWGHVKQLYTVTSAKPDGYPSVDATGNVLVFESGRAGAGQAIWLANRASSLDDFKLGTGPIAATNMQNEGQPYLDIASNGVYFISSARTDAGGYDIFFGNLDGGGLVNVKPVGGVNTQKQESSPAATQDGLQLYFSSDRDSDGGPSHMYVASRASTADAFGQPTLASDVDGRFTATWFSADDCRAYGARVPQTPTKKTQLVFSSRQR